MRPLFRILGSLEVEGAGPLGGPQQRELLRRLLLAANTVVPVDRLVDDVWGGAEPPEHAREALQVYVSRLRKAIPDGQKRIRWEQRGYRITIEEDELDAHRFERLVAEGRSLLAAADAAAAASAFDEALGLWRGPLDIEGSRAPELARLEELRLSAEEDRIDAELARSRERELVAELERLVAQEPLRERRRRQLMLALYRSGRQAEALAAYRDARRALVEELGLEPSAELRELEAAILRQDPALTVEPAELRARRRLPAPATPRIGRGREIAEVCCLLGGETRLVTLTGPGGTGKTRVAIQAAHDLAERFADGVSFVELAALRDPELVLPEIAQTLEVSDGRDPQSALADHLRDRSELKPSDEVRESCGRLDCLPLAIELAAARARELTPAEMLSLLASRLDLASSGPRDLPARQQTLRSTIEWSCELLDEGERRLFAALGVFAGGCTAEAAATVCDADPETLAALVEKSLVLRQQGRFTMLETIREYALERLRAEHDEAAVRRRHGEYFVELAVRLKPKLKGEDAAAALEQLAAEHDNVRAALDWSFDHEPEAYVRAVDALYLFWYVRGHYREGLRAFDRARTVAVADAGARADVLKLGAALAFACGEFSLARPLINEALLFYRSVGDTVNTARALGLLGLIATNSGEHEGAIELLEESTALARAGGEEVLSFALANLGYVALTTGNLERAYTASLEAVELHRASPPGQRTQSELGAALDNLGVAALLQGRLAEARTHLTESFSVRRRIKDALGLASSFSSLAALAVAHREFGRAARLLGAVDAARERTDAELEPLGTQIYERAAAAARDELGGDSFARLREEGRNLPLEEAAAVALED